MEQSGPLVRASWSRPSFHAGDLESGGSLSQPIEGFLLIDTGASHTCIAGFVAEFLGLKMVAAVPGFGSGGHQTNDFVAAKLKIPMVTEPLSLERRFAAIPDMERYSPNLRIGGQPVRLVGLLGRDILRHAVFEYDGRAGRFNLDITWPKREPALGS